MIFGSDYYRPGAQCQIRKDGECISHHRLLGTFLYEVLDYPIEEVHDEAKRLEHFISERFEEQIDAKLGRPKFDPHSHCIPALDGQMAMLASRPLGEIEEEGQFVVDSISDRDAALLKRLKAHGITPGMHLHVTGSLRKELILRADGGRATVTSLDLWPVLCESATQINELDAGRPPRLVAGDACSPGRSKDSSVAQHADSAGRRSEIRVICYTWE